MTIAALAGQANSGAGLLDAYGRRASDLRISLTDKCSLRCTYCMPAEGLPWLSQQAVLTEDEIVRLATVFLALGVSTIRLTGGEPLVRAGVAALVRRLAALTPAPELSLTTNGIALADQAQALATAGLARINVSLDTLNRDRFAALTRRDRLPDVLRGLAAASAAGLAPIKINAVLIQDTLAEAPQLTEWALRAGYRLRFIEHMPLDADHGWSRAEMVTAADVRAVLAEHFSFGEVAEQGSNPAEEFEVLDGPGREFWAPGGHRLGVIASVTQPFCRNCDRLRLTADGQLRTCLFGHDETDLRAALRAGATAAELADLITVAVAAKPEAHGIGLPGFRQPSRPMSAIGG